MNRDFLQKVALSNSHRHQREGIAFAALSDPESLEILFGLAARPDAKGHFQAWWALEIVTEKNPGIVFAQLPALAKNLPILQHEGAIRSASKICMLFCQTHFDRIDPGTLALIHDSCLFWLVSGTKVAAKAYSARALYEIGLRKREVLAQLQEILATGYGTHSAAYKAAARDIIKKIGKLNR